MREHQLQCNFFIRYRQYIPKALGLWPVIGPTDGKRCLPKRPGASVRTGRASFTADVLGALGGAPRSAPEAERSQDSSAAPPPRSSEAPQEGTRRHDWRWKDHRWVCVSCLTTARTAVPPRLGKCAGMATNLAKLVRNPMRHTLQLATFADGSGVVVVCSKCGHYATSNRPAELHKKLCRATGGQPAFASPGAASAYRRIAEGKHPKHAKGEAKVLDPCMPLAALAGLAQTSQEPSSQPT